MDWYVLIRDALDRQRVLELTFDSGSCLVEPHAFGRAAGGHDVLLAYQLQSPLGVPCSGWRLYPLSRIRAVSLCSHEFSGPRHGFFLDPRAMQLVYGALG